MVKRAKKKREGKGTIPEATYYPPRNNIQHPGTSFILPVKGRSDRKERKIRLVQNWETKEVFRKKVPKHGFT